LPLPLGGNQLGLGAAVTRIAEYRYYLAFHPEEWPRIDELCRISISRFYRDRSVFDCLRDEVLLALAEAVIARAANVVRRWSAGCASGEEIYAIVLLRREHLQSRFPQVQLRALATDVDDQMLRRARRAEYPVSSLKDAPSDWRESAFTYAGEEYLFRPEYRRQVEFHRQDVRTDTPTERFHLIFCRNFVLTYFAEHLQRQVLGRIVGRIVPGEFLVIGKHETLPEGVKGIVPCRSDLGIYQAIASA
jgi:chemotaxis protein methyltransferase CheR